jgi:ABC-2 type transport system ATP-binding protein
LDEPTIGLDVLVKLKIRKFLKEINEKYNTTILLTTHDISDIEALCERVIMLDEGKIIYDGSLQELKTNWGEGKQIQFTFSTEVMYEELHALTSDLTVKWRKGEPSNSWVAHVSPTNVPDVIGRVVARYEIQDMNINEISTEEIIRNIYEEGVVHG